MPNHKKTVATAKAKIADAEAKAFMARLEALEAILDGAAPHDVMMLCAQALAAVAPDCCEAHEEEFRTELLQMLSECTEMQEEQDAAEADEDDDAHTSVH
jgi:hypothetical protein